MEDKNLKVIIILIVGSVFSYFLFNWVMSALIHQRKEVMVPDIQGKSLKDAISIVSSINLGMKKDGDEFNQNIPAGTIIRQNPLPGMSVREGKIIRITLSRGGEVIFVPDLKGLPLRSAEITIRSSGFCLGEESSRYSIVVQKGYVISQDPPAATIAERDSIINLVVSSGLPEEGIVLMPQWVGRNINDAKKWAEKNRYLVQIFEENNETVAAGTILTQKPFPDTELSSQEEMIFIIATSDSVAEKKQILSGKRFYYEIPQGGENREIKLKLLDEKGEKEIFRGIRAPGSKLEIPIETEGIAKVRVFINNILVEEREVK